MFYVVLLRGVGGEKNHFTKILFSMRLVRWYGIKYLGNKMPHIG